MKKRILLAEDSPAVRQLMSFTLRGAGYEVEESSNGEEALEKISASDFDMVITDMNMPRMNGLVLITQIRKELRKRFIPIVVLTAERDPSLRGQAKDIGANAWIPKPFKPTNLLEVVRTIIPIKETLVTRFQDAANCV